MPEGFDLQGTIRGVKSPVLVGPTEAWWSTRTPDGPGSLALEIKRQEVTATAWGPGADWLCDQAPRLFGSDDDLKGWDPKGVLRDPWRRAPFRLGRSDRLWDALVGGVLGQRVQVTAARRSRRLLARRFGEPAPGPREAWLLPSPATVSEMGYHQFHPLGVERKRAQVLIAAARELPRLGDSITAGRPAEVQRRLQRIRGIGPWTAALATAVAMGDPDAVPVGDYHIPNGVSWHLAGEARGTDERMLQLLEPYSGHRWRVVRIIKSLGAAPRYGPRLALNADGLALGS